MGLFDAFSGSTGRKYAMAEAQAFQNGQQQGNDALDTAYGRASDAYGQAGSTLGNLASSYQNGSTMYQDALGLNGPTGTAAARTAYTASPGYQFNLDQGLQALARQHAVAGTGASGGADTDAMRFASGLASQDYNSWLSNLSNLDTKRYGATAGQAGTYGQLGSAALGVGSAKANLASSTAQGIAAADANAAKATEDAQSRTLGSVLGLVGLGGSALGGLAGNGNALSNIGKNLTSAFSIFG